MKATKKLLSLMLSVCMALSMAPVSVLAEEGRVQEAPAAEASEGSAIVPETVTEEEPDQETLSVQETGPVPEQKEAEEENPEEPAGVPDEEQQDAESAPELPEEPAKQTEASLTAEKSAEEMTWADLQESFNRGGTVTLTGNVTAPADASALKVPKKTDVILELNGYTLDRGLSGGDPLKDGSVIIVLGSLEVRGPGVITGGNTTGTGGGVWVRKDAYFNFTGGTISGNYAMNTGGGVYVSGSGSSFCLDGGTVKDNTAKNGGGIGQSSTGDISILSGSITGNAAENNGGGIWFGGGSYTELDIKGGIISGNTAAEMGGGVYINSSRCTMSGGSVTDNSAKCGGGIYIKGGSLDQEGGTVNGNHAEADPEIGRANGSGQASYSITVDPDITGGTVTADKTSAGYGETVTLTAVPASEEHILRSLTVTASNGDPVTVTEGTFIMPGSSVTVTAVFERKERHWVQVDHEHSDHNGNVSINGSFAEQYYEGETVTVTAEPYSGSFTASWSVMMRGETGFDYTVPVPNISHPDPNTITFPMPSSDVSVYAAFSSGYDDHLIFIRDMDGGTVTADKTIAQYGDIVTLTIRPGNGYEYVPGSLRIVQVDRETLEEMDMPEYAITEAAENSRYQVDLGYLYSRSDIYVSAEFTKAAVQTKYTVLVDDDTENGKLTADIHQASEGWTVTVTAEPESYLNYELESLMVLDTAGNPIEVTDLGYNRYEFTMPAGDVFVTGTFRIPVFPITVTASGGEIHTDEEAEYGFPVTAWFVMPAGHDLKSLTVTGDETGENYPIALRSHNEGSALYIYSFTMPHEAVTVSAEFEIITYSLDMDASLAGTLVVSVNGEVRDLPCRALADDEIGLSYTPPEFYSLHALKYQCLINGEPKTINLAFTPKEDGTYTASFKMRESDTTILAEPEKPTVSYTGTDGETEYQHACDVVTEGSTEWKSGWYAVKKAVTIGERIEVRGSVNLILGRDGQGYSCRLDVPEGIHVPEGSSLFIWNEDSYAGEMNIQGTEAGNAGIGGNAGESGGAIAFYGGVRIAVTAGAGAEAIGKGAGGTDSGSLDYGPFFHVMAGEDYVTCTMVPAAERKDACRSPYLVCLSSPLNHSFDYTNITKNTHQLYCPYCGVYWEAEPHYFGYDGTDTYCYDCHYNEAVITFDPNGGGYSYHDPEGGYGSYYDVHIGIGSSFTLYPSPEDPPEGYVFAGWQVGSDPRLRQPGYSFKVTGDITIKAIWNLDPWLELEHLVNEAEEGSTVVLQRDYTASPDSRPLDFDSADNITLDLNGHTIDRNLSSVDDKGYVFSIHYGSSLTIRDSGTAGTGKITGGWNDYSGGAVRNYGTLIIEGGSFSGNRSEGDGGAIYNTETLIIRGGTFTGNTACSGGAIYNNEELTIEGGTFSNNTADSNDNPYNGFGGAVCSKDTLTISGGTFEGNSASYGGAVSNTEELVVSGGSFLENRADVGGAISNYDILQQSVPSAVISGGRIKDNTAVYGSAVYGQDSETTISGGEISDNKAVASSDKGGYGTVFCMRGGDYTGACGLTVTGGRITGNKAELAAGVLASNCDFNISDMPVITGNVMTINGFSTSINSNVVMGEGMAFNVTGPLSENAHIGVMLPEHPAVFTSGLAGRGSAANFLSDDENYSVLRTADGEAVLGVPVTISFAAGEGGSGSMEDVTAAADLPYPLPECGFTGPEGKVFAGWQAGEETKEAGETVTVSEDTVITALWAEALTEPAFKKHSLVLSGQIGVNFFMDLSCLTDEEKAAGFMEFTVSGRNGSTTTDPFDAGHMSRTGGFYGFTCYVNSVQMADTITAVYHYGEGRTVTQEYSVARYLAFFDEHAADYDEKTLELIHSIADYGHYAQPFLADTNGWTIGTDHAEMTMHYAQSYDLDTIGGAVADHTFIKKIEGSGITKATYRLRLDSETTVDVYLTVQEGTEVTASANFNGKTYPAAKQSDGRYLVRISGISAHKLGDLITVTGTAGSEFSVTVSALSYVRSVLKNESFNADAKNAMAALYKYYAAVMKYRGN